MATQHTRRHVEAERAGVRPAQRLIRSAAVAAVLLLIQAGVMYAGTLRPSAEAAPSATSHHLRQEAPAISEVTGQPTSRDRGSGTKRRTRSDGSVEGIRADELTDAIDVRDGALVGSRRFRVRLRSTETYLEFEHLRKRHWVRSTPLGFKSTPGKTSREVIVFDDVMKDVRVTQRVYEGRTKEEITLLSADAPTTFRFRLACSPGLVIKKRGETIAFLHKASRRTLMRVEAPYAVDAENRRYGYAYELDGNTLTLQPVSRLKGVSYPLVIDPSYTIVTVGAGSVSTSYSSQRKLTRTRDGNLHAVYNRTATVNNAFYAVSSDGGQTWAETNLSNEVTYAQDAPSICTDSGGNLHVVWHGQHAGSPTYRQIRYRKYTVGSGWDAGPFDLTAESYNQWWPVIATDSRDQLHVAWQGTHSGSPVNNQIRYRTYIVGSGWDAGPTNVTSETGYHQYLPSLAVDSRDGVHVVYYGAATGSPTTFQIKHQSRLGGSWTTTPTFLTSGTYSQQFPSLAIDSSDNLHVAWSGRHAGSTTLYQTRYLKRTGSTWDAAPTNITAEAYNQYNSAIAVDASDNLQVVWHGQHAGSVTYTQIRYAGYTSGSGWDPAPTNLTASATTNQLNPNIMWARWPMWMGEVPGRPAKGYAFIWADGASVKYYASSDLLFESQPGSGLLGYGSATAGEVGQKYRTWAVPGSIWSAETSGPVGGVTTNWSVVKASPTHAGVYVMAMVTTEASDNFKVYSYRAGAWTLEFTRTMSAAQATYRLFDVAFDAWGRPLVVYGQSSSATTVYYRMGQWNGANFGLGGATENNFTFTTSIGNLRWLVLANKTNGNDMILAAVGDGGTNNINARVWNGSTFGNEGGAWGLVNTNTNWDFDCAWETASGDGMVAWGITASPYWRYATYSAGSWVVSGGSNPGAILTGPIRVLALDADPRPASNLIAVGLLEDEATDDVNGGVWNGTAWSSVTSLDTAVNSSAAGRQVDVMYAGQTGNTVLVFDDASTGDLDWSRSVNGAAFGGPQNLAASGGQDNNLQLGADKSSDKLMLTRLDSNSDIYAHFYTDGTQTWTSTNGGAALELDSSGGATRESYMFAYESAPARVTQRSYRFQNDDGANVNSNTNQAPADTPRTGVRKGERVTVRIQVDNTGGAPLYSKRLKLQYYSSFFGAWIDAAGGNEIGAGGGRGLAGADGDSLTSAVCSPNSNTWANGTWHESTNLTPIYTLNNGSYTEFAFIIYTADANVGATYPLRLVDNMGDKPLDAYSVHPTLTIVDAANDTLKYSKDTVAAPAANDGDVTYFLDDRGYSAVSADDGIRDSMTATALSPVFLFKSKGVSNINPIRITWDGQSSVAPSSNTVYLQIYDRFLASWVTLATNNSASADTDFRMTAELGGADVFRYYEFTTYVACWRVYQAAGNETLRTDLAHTQFGGFATQRSYRFLNDDGATVNSDTPQATADASRTAVKRGERIDARIQIDNTSTVEVLSNYRLQYDKSDNNWSDVATSTELRFAKSLAGANGDAITAPVCAANPGTWVDGVWQGSITQQPLVTLPANAYTELGFVIDTGGAAVGTTYRLRLYDVSAQRALNNYVTYPTLAVVDAAADLLRYSKEASATLAGGTTDLGYHLDDKGYSDVAFDDGQRDPITAWGNSEQRLNVMTTEAQQAPKAVHDPDTGRTLVIWGESRSGVYGVYGRLLDRTGRPAGSTDITICAATGTDPYPCVAVDSLHRRFLVVWTDYRNGRRDIYARFVDALGTVLGASDIAISTTATTKQAPAAAYDPNADRFLVAWSQWGTSYDVYGRMVNHDGSLYGGGDFAITTAAQSQTDISLAFSPTENRYLVAWSDYRSGTNYDVYGRIVNANGTLYGSTDVTISAQAQEQQRPAVACDSVNGRFLVAWEDSRAGFGLYDIYARLMNADGTPYTSESAVCNVTNAQTYVAAAFDPSNQRFLLAWSDARAGTNEIFGRLVNADGTPYGSSDTTICIASMNQWRSTVTYDSGANRFLVVWEDFRNWDYDVYSRFVAADASLAQSQPVFLFKSKNTTNTAPIVIVWDGQSNVAPSSKGLQLQIYDNGGSSWTTLATNTTGTADADVKLTSTLTTPTSQYFDPQNRVAVRVYQSAGDETLRTDQFQVRFGLPPNDTTLLNQYESDGTTTITVGADTQSGSDSNIYLKFSMASPNASDTLTPKVEVQPVGTPFTGTPTRVGTAQAYSGTPIAASVAVSGLVPGTGYHWRAWVTGAYGDSGYVSFGANPEDERDFRVATNLAAQISAPLDGATVEGMVTVSGMAAGANFASYILDWGKGGNPKTWTTIATSTTPVISGTLGVWDASAERGAHKIRLRVFDGVGGVKTIMISVLVVKPTPIGGEAGQRATAWGNQRKLVRTTDATLCAFYEDNSGGVVWKKSTNGGGTWSTEATLTTTGDEITVVKAANDDLHIAYHSTGGANVGVVYRKATRNGGGWVLSSEVPLSASGAEHRNPALVLDQDGLPHIVWGKGTTAAPAEAAIYWRRAIGDPTVPGNWAGQVTISATPAVNMGNPNGNPYVGAVLLHHASTNDLYAVFNVDTGGTGKVCVNRAPYSGGTWTWGSYYEGGSEVSDRPPSAVLVASTLSVLARNGSSARYMDLPIGGWNNAATWNSYTLSSTVRARSSASITYDSLGSLYAFYTSSSQTNGAVAYRLLPAGAVYDGWRTEQVMTTDNTGHNHPNAKLGSNGQAIEWLWTNRTAAPYRVLYDRIGLLPPAPTSLTQYEADHTSIIATGAATADGAITNLYLDMSMSSTNVLDTLTPMVEVRPVGTPFTGTATHLGFSEPYSGSPVTGSVTLSGLALDTNYHWQAWVLGEFGAGDKVSFGSNEETATDFRIESAVTLTIDSTFNRDGTPGGGTVDFGTTPPSAVPYLVHTDADKHAVQMGVWSNATWSLTASAPDLDAGGGKTIPISQLAWSLHGAGAWTPFQNAPFTILSGQTPTTGTTLRHDYQLDVTWADQPGGYATSVTYTVATP